MNELGIALLSSALQVTLLGFLTAGLYGFARRHGLAAAARTAALGLCILVVLTLMAFCPLPSWWSWTLLFKLDLTAESVEGMKTETTATAVEAPPLSAPPVVETAGEDRGIGWSLARMHDVWRNLALPRTDENDSDRHWPAAVPILFLAGAGLGLLRLGLGLWGVSRIRRRSRPIDDAALHALLRELRVTMNCQRDVDIRESHELPTPATVGWRHPLILLPDDWQSWAEDELRAVLAHELAHIHRADYAAGLLARISLVIHFYHPLAHWLAGRLQLQQELAADALGATCAGGRAIYLRALARLLLRQDGQSPRGPMRTFLSPSGTLLRRIHMLRAKDSSPRRPLSRSAVMLILIALTLATVGISALRGPAQQPRPDSRTPADIYIDVRENKSSSLVFGVGVNSNSGLTGSIVLNERNYDTSSPSAEKSRRMPFDLSYLPPDAAGVLALRPAEFFRRPGAAALADSIDAAIIDLLKTLNLPDQPVLHGEAIEQIIAEVQFSRNEKAPKGQQNLLMLSPTMIRTEKDFDWKKRMQTLVSNVKEVSYRGKTYFKGKLKAIGLSFDICYFIPDERTLVVHSEKTMRRILDDRIEGKPLVVLADWQRVEQGLLAYAVDLRRVVKTVKDADPDMAPLFENAAHLVIGADLQETLAVRAFAFCLDNKTAASLVNWAQAQIAEEITALEKKQGDKTTPIPFADRLARNLLKHARIAQNGTETSLRTQAAIDFAELGKLLRPAK